MDEAVTVMVSWAAVQRAVAQQMMCSSRDISSAVDASSQSRCSWLFARTLYSLRGSVDFCSIGKCSKTQFLRGGLDISIPSNPETVCGNSTRFMFY